MSTEIDVTKKFQPILEQTGCDKFKVVLVQTRSYLGNLSGDEIKISSNFADLGLGERHLKAVVLHEIGHYKNGLTNVLIRFTSFVTSILCIAFLILFLLFCPYRFLNIHLPEGSAFLINYSPIFPFISYIFLAFSISTYLLAEQQANDYARSILAKSNLQNLVDETYTIPINYEPQRSFFSKLDDWISVRSVSLFLSRKEMALRAVKNNWIFLPFLPDKTKS